MIKKKFKLPNSVILVPPDKTDSIYEESFIGAIRKFRSNQPSFDWRKYQPVLEKQGNTSDCTCFSRCNCAETVAKKSNVLDDNGNEFNFSDLYLAVGSGTSQNGNSLKAPSEFFRTKGVVLQKFCDYDSDMLSNPNGTWARRVVKFNAAKNNTKAKKYKGGNYSFITFLTSSNIKDALQYSPVQIAIGLGESYNNDGIIPAPKNVNCYHAITLQYINTLGQYYIFDHYDQKNKILVANYPITQALSFRDLPETWRGNVSDDEIFYVRMVGKLILRVESHGELYEVTETCLEKVEFSISNKKVWQIVQTALRPNIVGITEKDFNRLKTVAIENGQGVKEDIKLISYSDSLKLGKKKSK